MSRWGEQLNLLIRSRTPIHDGHRCSNRMRFPTTSSTRQ